MPVCFSVYDGNRFLTAQNDLMTATKRQIETMNGAAAVAATHKLTLTNINAQFQRLDLPQASSFEVFFLCACVSGC
jgi:hypothetical protein